MSRTSVVSRSRRRQVPAIVLAAGLLFLAQASPALAADTTAPTITTPGVRFLGGSRPTTSSAPIRIHWVSSDDWTGVEAHQVQQSIDGGAWTNMTLADPAALFANRVISLGHTYTFRVRAKDYAGNWSAYKTTGTPFRLLISQETSGSFSWGSYWTRIAQSGALSGYTKYAPTDGTNKPTSATFTFTGRAVAWVGAICGRCGMADVHVSGAFMGSVNSYGGTDVNYVDNRRVMWQRSWSSAAARSLKIDVEATFLHPRIYVDAMAVLVPAA